MSVHIMSYYRELDFFNIMAYDMAGSWDPMVGHHTNLYSAPGDTGNLVAHVVVNMESVWCQ